MTRGPNNSGTATRIILYIFGVALILAAIFIVLRGSGVLSVIPDYVIWAFVLLAVGSAILGAIGSIRGW